MKPATSHPIKAYLREFVGSMALYILTLFGVVAADPTPGTPAAMLWLLPTLPLLLVLWAILRQYKRADEFFQRLHSESFALGAILVGAFCMIYGFGENAGWPDIPLMWVAPAMIAAWGLSLPVVMRRYR